MSTLPHLIFLRSAGFSEADALAKLAEYNDLFGLTGGPNPYAVVFGNLSAQADPADDGDALADPPRMCAAWAFCISDAGRRPSAPSVDVYPDSVEGRALVTIPAGVLIEDVWDYNPDWYVQATFP